MDSVGGISLADVQRFYDEGYRPNGAILSVAGKIDWEPLKKHVGKLFADWQPREMPPLAESSVANEYHHIPHESTQTHIGVSFASVPYSHADYFQARGAVGVLSDGMSSRLFTEVREKRGLCYSVYAAGHSLRDRGCVFCYSGTSTERAQETLNVLVEELVKLAEGVRPDELGRLKAQIKSGLVMQQESSRARSSAIAGDWYHLGRVRTMEEIGRIIDGLTCESINAYLAERPPSGFQVVTLGASPLEVPGGVS
jgi:predicted Zn-dependent peptidase